MQFLLSSYITNIISPGDWMSFAKERRDRGHQGVAGDTPEHKLGVGGFALSVEKVSQLNSI